MHKIMTNEEIKAYIADKEHDQILRDEIGRWTKRIWNTAGGTIEEVYEYHCAPEQVLANPHKYRNSFDVKSVDVKEVANGN